MTQARKDAFNVPNQLSMARLALSVAVFALIPLHFYWIALIVFVIAAGTDWVDGWYARKYDQVTQLGRILDPFCDKILICGTYILVAVEMTAVETLPWYAIIAGWMAVVIVGRELLVTVIRSLVEGSGGDFSAKMAGKLKMWFQCIAVGAALVALALKEQSPEADLPMWLFGVLVIFVWASIASTLYSGWLYVLMARPAILGESEPGDE
ncbi:MAG: CDP-diacylglycerol--glycerol-3-phosphate 3-phosphatidyltransferase [Mariniblastus sp.]|nr:CDP-diacylglycerol--glycerol-3-phosphate 3-phosphatidyltransferase [Mariniblastus sp.]